MSEIVDGILLRKENTFALAKQGMQSAMQRFAVALTNLPVEDSPDVLQFLRRLETMAEDTKKIAHERILLYLTAKGETVGEKGSVMAELGGKKVTAIPTRSGTDPKKVAALLIAKGYRNYEKEFFSVKIAYEMRAEDLAALLANNTLTADEVAACAYDKNYRVDVKELRP